MQSIETRRLVRFGLWATLLWLPAELSGQAEPVIDTVVIVRDNVFTAQQAQSSKIFRVMNTLHITTHRPVIENELLFEVGEPYDSARIAESERNLRNMQIFSEVDIDTTRIGDRFAVVVRTQDGWSTKPKFKFGVASDGTVTGVIGINEINLLGTGSQIYVAYEKQVDRDGLNLSAKFQRLFGSNVDASGNYAGLSDGKNANWRFGQPFRTLESRRSMEYDGLAADQRILQYFLPDASTLDTIFYRRTAFTNNVTGALAARGETTRYLRIAATAGVRREEYVLEQDTGMTVPDTVTGTVGIWGEYRKAHYMEVRRFNGIGAEDLDLSTTIRLTANLAPKGFGWERSGIGPGVAASATVPLGTAFIWTALDANGLFTDAGLDSGRVILNVAFGWKPGARHAMALQMQAGMLENEAPGQEFDLGYTAAPRSWEPHSFVGNRELWVQFEHKWFVWDKLLDLVGVALAGFFEYGGAWYDGQPRRYGGNAGVGLRLGSALSTVPRTGRLDIGYRFGEDVTGDRWVISFGSGFVFPRRDIPVISYTAAPPP
jgi:hypothetical protein